MATRCFECGSAAGICPPTRDGKPRDCAVSRAYRRHAAAYQALPWWRRIFTPFVF